MRHLYTGSSGAAIHRKTGIIKENGKISSYNVLTGRVRVAITRATDRPPVYGGGFVFSILTASVSGLRAEECPSG